MAKETTRGQVLLVNKLNTVVGTKLTEREALSLFRHAKVADFKVEGGATKRYIRVTVEIEV